MRRILAAAAMAAAVISTTLLGAGASAVEVTVHNCTSKPLRVVTDDEGAMLQTAARTEYEIAGAATALARCAGVAQCKFQVFYEDTSERFETAGPLYVRYSTLVGLYEGASCGS